MNTIITIGRQYGSGGRFVGKKIAEHYGIKFWDNELLDRVAAESGYAREILERERAVTVREKAIQEAEKDIRIDSIFEKINSHSREARLADEPQQKPRGLNLSFIW